MLPNFIVRDFIEKFSVLDGKKVNVTIKHLLYGNQTMSGCVPRPFADEERIGFIIEDEERYINMDELNDIYIDSEKCYIKSEVMELYIDYVTL